MRLWWVAIHTYLVNSPKYLVGLHKILQREWLTKIWDCVTISFNDSKLSIRKIGKTRLRSRQVHQKQSKLYAGSMK
jgi:hypothetical protein